MKKKIIIAFAILLFMPGLSPATPKEKPGGGRVFDQDTMICIDKKKQTFAQVFEDFGQQTGLNIQIKGNMPTVTKDIFFSEVSFNHALSKTLKLYDVQNHAFVYNSEMAAITLYIFESSLQLTGLPFHEGNESDLNIIETLSKEQIDQLIPEKEHKPLTQEQIDQLIPEKEHKSLTQEQIDQLIPEKEHKPLTQEQIDQLIPE